MANLLLHSRKVLHSRTGGIGGARGDTTSKSGVVNQKTEKENREIETELQQCEKEERINRMKRKAREWQETYMRKRETESTAVESRNDYMGLSRGE